MIARMKGLMAALALAGFGLSGCMNDSGNDKASGIDLNASRSKWTVSEPAEYTYTIHRYCECSPAKVLVRANRDSVISAELPAENLATPTTLPDRQGFSIEAVFSELGKALDRDSDSRKVSFNGTFGFPDTVEIDFDKGMADEELFLRITDFTVVE
jgi:hypothetical protein